MMNYKIFSSRFTSKRNQSLQYQYDALEQLGEVSVRVAYIPS